MKFTLYYLGFGQPTTEDSHSLPDQPRNWRHVSHRCHSEAGISDAI